MSQEKFEVNITSWDDVDRWIDETRNRNIIISKNQQKYDDAVLKLEKKYKVEQQQAMDENEVIKKQIRTFCESHRKEMTSEMSKVLKNGEVNFRKLKGSLQFDEGVKNEDVIDKLTRMKEKGKAYLRTKLEINKDAIKSALDSKILKPGFLAKLGLVIFKGESFTITPNPKK